MKTEAFIRYFKKATGILVLFSLSIHCIYQLGVISYFFTNQDFIIKELCIKRNNILNDCQGRCFIDNKLTAGEQEKNNLPKQQFQLQEINLCFVPGEALLSFLQLVSTNEWLMIDLVDRYSCYRSNFFHPPRAS